MRQDKRAYQRLPISTSVRYQRKGSQEFAASMGKDISDNGVGFISNEFFPISTPLVFEMRHPQSREFIKAPGEVVWVSNQPHSERFYVGARFTEPAIAV